LTNPSNQGSLPPRPRTKEWQSRNSKQKQCHFSNPIPFLKPQRSSSSFRSHTLFFIIATMSVIARLRAIAPSLKSLKFNPHRPFGSAAALQYQYDDEEDEFELCVPRGMLDTEGSSPERGVHWVMIGEPGAKRHVFAEKLSKLLEVPHISMASLLHQELNPRSSLYQQVIIF
jgi:hypothetical protein